MASVILLQSLAGSAFCLNAGTMIECDDEESKRFIEAGIARELMSDEPTELQTLTAGKLPKVVDPKPIEPQVTESAGSEQSEASPIEQPKPKSKKRS